MITLPTHRITGDGFHFKLERRLPAMVVKDGVETPRKGSEWGHPTYHDGFLALAARLLKDGALDADEQRTIIYAVAESERRIVEALERAWGAGA